MQQAWNKMDRQIILETLKQVESSWDQGLSGKANIGADLHSNKVGRYETISIWSKNGIFFKSVTNPLLAQRGVSRSA
jgi:hypothetical protein